MAVASDPRDFAAPGASIGPKAATAIFYIVIAVIAMGIAIPAAFMTAGVPIFEECFGDAQTCAPQ